MIEYNLFPESVRAFLDNALADTFEALDRGHPEECDIYITIGKHRIRIPTGADNFNAIELALYDCFANEEENR